MYQYYAIHFHLLWHMVSLEETQNEEEFPVQKNVPAQSPQVILSYYERCNVVIICNPEASPLYKMKKGERKHPSK